MNNQFRRDKWSLILEQETLCHKCWPILEVVSIYLHDASQLDGDSITLFAVPVSQTPLMQTSSDANLGQCRHHVPTKTKGRILHSSNTSPKGVGMRTALIFYQVSSLKSTLASSCLFEFFFWRMWLPSMHLSLKGLVKQWMFMSHLPFKWKEEKIQEGEAS